MVTTRRKSAVSYKDISDDEMDVDGLVNDGEASKSLTRSSKRAAHDDAEDDSDEDIKLKTKKRKTTSKITKKGRLTARSLMKGLFSTLPLDLIYEIFGHLHPLDLVHLAWTSKMLRSHLMSKCSISIWMTAREAVIPPVPECPKDQSEPQWAMLLFTHNCTMCGTPRIQKVDWNLRLRGCETCFKEHILYGRTASKAYPDIEDLDTVLELLPWTNTGGWAHGHSSSRKFYFSTHIVKMAEIVEDFHLRTDAGVKGARAEFDEFKEEKKAEAAEQAGSGKELKEWARDAARMRYVTGDQLREERKQAMIDKLMELGHNTRDVLEAAGRYGGPSSIFRTRAPLSNSVWKRARPKAEMLVEEERQRRLDIERQPTRDARKKVALLRYDAFIKTYDASPDRLLPHDSVLIDLPIIKAAIRTDGDDISPNIFDEAFDQLPALLDGWRRDRRVELARIILEAQVAPGGVKPDPIAAEQEGFLSLATSFFSTCTLWAGNDPTAHWIETMHTHFTRTDGYHPAWSRLKTKYKDIKCIQTVPESYERAKALIELVGLDPRIATQLDMDEVDARFWCKNCSALRGRHPNVARNWRNCIMHLDVHVAQFAWKGWEVLSPEDRATIKSMERSVSSLNFEDVERSTVAVSLEGTAINLRGVHVEFDTGLETGSSSPSSRAEQPQISE